MGGLTAGVLGLDASATKVTAFEYIGDTYRDFELALDTSPATLADGAVPPFSTSETYLQSRTAVPVETESTSKKKSKKKKFSFTDGLSLGGMEIGDVESPWQANFFATRRDPNEIVEADAVAFQMGAVITNNANGLTLRFGEGQGALAFSGGSQFGLISDHDIATGGANPFLGLASGGFYAGVDLPMTDRFSLALGITQDEDRHGFIDPDTNEWRSTFDGVADYRAMAINMALGYNLSAAVALTVSYTQLNEATGLLGTQGSGAFALEGGAVTDAITLGADADLGRGYALSLSATAGSTRTTEFDQSLLSIGENGIRSTAFQIAASKFGVFGGTDSVRASFAQPVHLEAGSVGVTSLQVVDRETGETAFVTETPALEARGRRFVSELLYAAPVFDGRGEISAFGKVEFNNRELGVEQTALAGGLRFSTRF